MYGEWRILLHVSTHIGSGVMYANLFYVWIKAFMQSLFKKPKHSLLAPISVCVGKWFDIGSKNALMETLYNAHVRQLKMCT